MLLQPPTSPAPLATLLRPVLEDLWRRSGESQYLANSQTRAAVVPLRFGGQDLAPSPASGQFEEEPLDGVVAIKPAEGCEFDEPYYGYVTQKDLYLPST